MGAQDIINEVANQKQKVAISSLALKGERTSSWGNGAQEVCIPPLHQVFYANMQISTSVVYTETLESQLSACINHFYNHQMQRRQAMLKRAIT